MIGNHYPPNHDGLWGQFIKLGDMMGDGQHHEPGGGWITREYNKLAKILCPEIVEANKQRKELKNKAIDLKIAELVEKKPCECGQKLRQSRSGSMVLYCDGCKKRFKAIGVTSKSKVL